MVFLLEGTIFTILIASNLFSSDYIKTGFNNKKNDLFVAFFLLSKLK
jgi:hypothetical protein